MSQESNEAKPIDMSVQPDVKEADSQKQEKLFAQREANRQKRSVLPNRIKAQLLNKSASASTGINQVSNKLKNQASRTFLIENSPYSSVKPENNLNSYQSQQQLGVSSKNQRNTAQISQTGEKNIPEAAGIKSELEIGSRVSNRDFIIQELEQDGQFKVGPKIDQSIRLRQELNGLSRRAKSQQRSRPKLKQEKF